MHICICICIYAVSLSLVSTYCMHISIDENEFEDGGRWLVDVASVNVKVTKTSI